MQYIYLCDDTIDGILSCIYQAWEDGHGHSNNTIQLIAAEYNRQLFCEYIETKTDLVKAKKVARTITKKISWEFYEHVIQASVSYDPRKADTIYRSIIYGLRIGKSTMNHLAHPAISHLFSLSRNVINEVQHFNGFIRFSELQSGLLFARFRPKNDILYFLSNHFCDRFPEEDFIIADVGRNTLLLHAKGRMPIIQNHMKLNLEQMQAQFSDNEPLLQDLFCTFVDTLSIDSRKNISLQKQNLPLRLREFMFEFQ